ncbi:hypothetical protein [Bailinhaonella thermotolerans]|uniref:Mce-associated membrane protein n=1 Tax=Bailinhaonella thermotolerans TaxID=1070861 RepID=A0A3A4B2B5_9ACTN|nr:hypothetical protein [Bailinhaonella thermotolerans]RJL34308.1 hypothetical protein D5H75_07610 [Bailinhaonella thermotolerans]
MPADTTKKKTIGPKTATGAKKTSSAARGPAAPDPGTADAAAATPAVTEPSEGARETAGDAGEGTARATPVREREETGAGEETGAAAEDAPRDEADGKTDAAAPEEETAARAPGGPGGGDGRVTADESPGRGPWAMRVLGVAVVLALAATITTAVILWREKTRLTDEKDARAAVATVASQWADVLTSYDYKNFQATRDRALAIASRDYAKPLKTMLSDLEAVVTGLQASARNDVTDVMIGGVDDNRATAIVTVDYAVTSPKTGTRRVDDLYLEVKLVREKNRWLVGESSHISAGNEQVVKPDGTVVPGTPTPAPTASPGN